MGKISAIFMAMIFGGILGWILSNLTVEIYDVFIFNNQWFYVRWGIFGLLACVVIYWIIKIFNTCTNCLEAFTEEHIQTETLGENYIQKDEKIRENGRDRYIRKSYKIIDYKGYYRCRECGSEYTKTWQSKVEV